VAENLFLERMDQPPFTRRGWLDWDVIRSEAAGLIQRFDVRTPSVDVHAGKLSGGNAQKLVLARELARQPRVLLAAQPTRGLDVSAIEFVHRSLIEQRDAGLAILLISTELDEILALSDRILVMYNGQIIGQMDAADADLTRIGLLLAGAAQAVSQGQAA
jgi:simple sugar transport system ATP-binding protein